MDVERIRPNGTDQFLRPDEWSLVQQFHTERETSPDFGSRMDDVLNSSNIEAVIDEATTDWTPESETRSRSDDAAAVAARRMIQMYKARQRLTSQATALENFVMKSLSHHTQYTTMTNVRRSYRMSKPTPVKRPLRTSSSSSSTSPPSVSMMTSDVNAASTNNSSDNLVIMKFSYRENNDRSIQDHIVTADEELGCVLRAWYLLTHMDQYINQVVARQNDVATKHNNDVGARNEAELLSVLCQKAINDSVRILFGYFSKLQSGQQQQPSSTSTSSRPRPGYHFCYHTVPHQSSSSSSSSAFVM